MLVMSTSLRYRAPTALIPALGVATSNLLWISLAAGGIAAFAAQFPIILNGLKIAGVCFIAWLAWSLATADPSSPMPARNDAPPRGKLFARGVGLQLLNPNALVFFGLLLPSYFDMTHPVVPQTLIMMATITVCEMTGLTLYAWLADGMNHHLNRRLYRWFNRGLRSPCWHLPVCRCVDLYAARLAVDHFKPAGFRIPPVQLAMLDGKPCAVQLQLARCDGFFHERKAQQVLREVSMPSSSSGRPLQTGRISHSASAARHA